MAQIFIVCIKLRWNYWGYSSGTRTHWCSRQASSERMGEWTRRTHVLLVSRCAAPRAVLLLRLIFAACVRARICVEAPWHRVRHTPRCWSRRVESRQGAFEVNGRRERGERCRRRVSGNPDALFISAASNSPPAAHLKSLFWSFDGALPKKSSGLCEHHARREMPAVRRSMHRYWPFFKKNKFEMDYHCGGLQKLHLYWAQGWLDGWVGTEGRWFSPKGSCNRCMAKKSCTTTGWIPDYTTRRPDRRWVSSSSLLVQALTWLCGVYISIFFLMFLTPSYHILVYWYFLYWT